MTTVRLLIDEPASGPWNMAVDEALWRSAEAGSASLRFYRWSQPTLSLGYFQTLADRAAAPAADHIPLVRRASGGGALVHDRELTYSLALPITDLAKSPLRDATALYAAVHQALIRVLATRGISAELAGCQTAQPEEPFLCFARRTPCDVVVGGNKVAGSAQRRSQFAILQHGGLIWGCSPLTPSLPGLAELGWSEASAPGALDALARDWASAIADPLAAKLTPSSLTVREQDAAARILADKYENPAWTQRR